jgi:hypothetical protein
MAETKPQTNSSEIKNIAMDPEDKASLIASTKTLQEQAKILSKLALSQETETKIGYIDALLDATKIIDGLNQHIVDTKTERISAISDFWETFDSIDDKITRSITPTAGQYISVRTTQKHVRTLQQGDEFTGQVTSRQNKIVNLSNGPEWVELYNFGDNDPNFVVTHVDTQKD